MASTLSLRAGAGRSIRAAHSRPVSDMHVGITGAGGHLSSDLATSHEVPESINAARD